MLEKAQKETNDLAPARDLMLLSWHWGKYVEGVAAAIIVELVLVATVVTETVLVATAVVDTVSVTMLLAGVCKAVEVDTSVVVVEIVKVHAPTVLVFVTVDFTMLTTCFWTTQFTDAG